MNYNLVMLLMLIKLQVGYSLKCYNCVTETNVTCLLPDVEVIDVMQCKKGQVCVKALHKVRSRTSLMRSCFYKNLTKQSCLDIPYTADCTLDYCETDLCNGHPSTINHLLYAIAVPILLQCFFNC